MKTLYFFIHLFTVSFPLIRSFEPKINYASRWRSLFPSIIVVAAFFIIWDIQFTNLGVWGFNDQYTLGIHLFSLPIEEWLFFVTVPFASVFIYDCVKHLIPTLDFHRSARFLALVLGITLLCLAFLYQSKNYTFWNFIFTGTFLLFTYWQNPQWLSSFWVTYAIHLIPFLLVNGILTGSFLDEPVVWYNNGENLGIRIFTIPIEDTMYALLLLVANISIYEYLNNYQQKRTITLTNQL